LVDSFDFEIIVNALLSEKNHINHTNHKNHIIVVALLSKENHINQLNQNYLNCDLVDSFDFEIMFNALLSKKNHINHTNHKNHSSDYSCRFAFRKNNINQLNQIV
jgi:hypothetical protein